MKKILLFLLLLPVTINAYGASATSAILMDTDSGRIIYQKDIHNVRSVASISKIMTAIVAIESGKLDEIVIVGDEINSAYGSGIYIKVGEELTLRDLVYGLMLRSGNDAALAIAHFVGGSVDNFVNLMNNQAKQIGMTQTTFNNPSGLDQEKGNYSTAYDMALLTKYAMQNPEFKTIVGTKKYELKTNLNYYLWNNKNKLLTTYKYATGGKTGFTTKAKRTLVTTASKNNVNLVAVTLNDGNDFEDHKNLFEEAFNEYRGYKILSKGKVKILGENYYKDSEFYLNEDFYYAMKKEELNNILIKFELQKNSNYTNNDVVGKVYVYLKEEKIYENKVYIKKVSKKNVIKKVLGYLW